VRDLRFVALLAVALSGCGPKTIATVEEAPDGALSRYLAAVRETRFADAYAMMSAAYRKDHDQATFERTLREHKEDVDVAAARLRAGGATVELRAEARYGDGETLPLVVEDGTWRIAADPLDFYPQSTPSEALRSFVRAVDKKRYDVVYRFVPGRHRSSFTVEQLRARWEGDKSAELADELAEVRSHLADPLEIQGDQARLALGEKREARLVREQGVWRIESLR
jgi:hypothetical protein